MTAASFSPASEPTSASFSSSSSSSQNAAASAIPRPSLEALFSIKAEQVLEKITTSHTYKKYKIDDLLFYSFSAITAYHCPIIFTVSAVYGCFTTTSSYKRIDADGTNFSPNMKSFFTKKISTASMCALLTAISRLGFARLRYFYLFPAGFVGGTLFGQHLATQFKSIEDKANIISLSVLKAFGARV